MKTCRLLSAHEWHLLFILCLLMLCEGMVRLLCRLSVQQKLLLPFSVRFCSRKDVHRATDEI